MNKVLLIICDGLPDRPIFELGDKTPLEAAYKPNLDKLASRGMTGLMHTVDIGVRPGSDVAHLSLLGYEINKYYPGRGPFEAAGLGLDLKPGDVAFRGNFATVDGNLKIIDRRAGRINDTRHFVKALDGMILSGAKVFVKAGVGHRAAVVFRGKNLDSRISDIDPHQEGVRIRKAKPRVNTSASKKTASLLNQFTQRTYEILSVQPLNQKRQKNGQLPANILLTRGAGMLPQIPSFYQKHGLKAACIAGAGLYKGIAKLLGMAIINVPSATGSPDTDVGAKIKAALAAFKKYDFVFVHIKGTDVLAEDGDFLGKKVFIEKIDKALLPLIKRDDLMIVVTSDHTTSSYLKIHTADPVPVLIAGKNLHTDQVISFGERSAVMGRLGHIQGRHLMPIILDFLGRAPLAGA